MEGATPEPAEWRRGRPHTPADIVKDQARCLASAGEGVGMMFKELERTGQLDNTLFIFTGDNGYFMGEHGLLDNKRWAYESSIRIPFLARYPPVIPAGSVRSQMALNIDVAPTVLELPAPSRSDRFTGGRWCR